MPLQAEQSPKGTRKNLTVFI